MSKLLTAAVRHVDPVVDAPDGSVLADVFADLDAHVGRLPPFLAHSSDEETIRAVWVFGREAWLAGSMPRLQREAIAAAVSARNTCPFCLEAHTMSLVAAERTDLLVASHVGDDPVAAVAAWAAAPASPSAAPPNPVPAEHAGPAIGTLVAFEYMNRLVNVLAADTPLAAVPKPMRTVMRKAGSKKMGASILGVQPDHSMHLIDIPAGPNTRDAALIWIDGWESTWPEIAASIADVDRVASGGLSAELGDVGLVRIERLLDEWDGGLSSSNTVLAKTERLTAAERLVATVAVHSHGDTDPLIDEVRSAGADDRSLVRLVAGGAWLAAERIGRWRSV